MVRKNEVEGRGEQERPQSQGGSRTGKQREFQEALLVLENQRRQLDALYKETQVVQAALAELASTGEALNSLKENRPGTELLVPLGSDSFMKAELKDADTVIVGVGAGYSVEKTVKDAEGTLDKRKEELMKALGKLREAVEKTNKNVFELSQMANLLAREIQAGSGENV